MYLKQGNLSELAHQGAGATITGVISPRPSKRVNKVGGFGYVSANPALQHVTFEDDQTAESEPEQVNSITFKPSGTSGLRWNEFAKRVKPSKFLPSPPKAVQSEDYQPAAVPADI